MQLETVYLFTRSRRYLHTTTNSMEPYRILGGQCHCTDAELKRAYRKLLLQHHPDKAGPASKAKCQEIIDAYEKVTSIRHGKSYARETRNPFAADQAANYDWFQSELADLEARVKASSAEIAKIKVELAEIKSQLDEISYQLADIKGLTAAITGQVIENLYRTSSKHFETCIGNIEPMSRLPHPDEMRGGPNNRRKPRVRLPGPI